MRCWSSHFTFLIPFSLCWFQFLISRIIVCLFRESFFFYCCLFLHRGSSESNYILINDIFIVLVEKEFAFKWINWLFTKWYYAMRVNKTIEIQRQKTVREIKLLFISLSNFCNYLDITREIEKNGLCLLLIHFQITVIEMYRFSLPPLELQPPVQKIIDYRFENY